MNIDYKTLKELYDQIKRLEKKPKSEITSLGPTDCVVNIEVLKTLLARSDLLGRIQVLAQPILEEAKPDFPFGQSGAV